MEKLLVTPGTLVDVQHVLKNLRASDREELALVGLDPALSVPAGWNASVYRRIVRCCDEPVAVFGVAPSPLGGGAGAPWMVATPRISEVSREFLIASVSEVETMRHGWTVLKNAVHGGNEVSVRWLRWLGFAIDETPVGPAGQYRMFEMPGLPGNVGGDPCVM